MLFPNQFKNIYPRSLLLFEKNIDWRITGRWTLYAALIGVLVAFAGIAFGYLVSTVTRLLLVDGAGYLVPYPGGEAADAVPFSLQQALAPSRRWLILLLPALGGLGAGWLVFTFAPEAEGHGTDGVIGAFHRKKGYIAPRVPLIKGLASALTIGSGGSAGREGPITQIGAGIASIISERFKLSDRERRILLVAGMSAGMGAIFRAPLGGAIFAVEVLYREDIESEALMPSVIAGIASYSVVTMLTESGAVFVTPAFQFVHPLELLPLILFAMICALVGILFVNIFYGTKKNVFDPLRMPPMLKPALGGLAVGVVGFFFPAVLGSSYGWLQQAIEGNLPVQIMGLLVVLKMLTTSLTISSGGSGGVFAPSLVIGGMMGGVFGNALKAIAPGLVTQPEAYVMIGMATFVAGVANVPISTTIMISELTGSYTLLVPLLLSGVLVHVTTRRWSLFREQVRASSDSPVHRMNLMPDLLKRTRVDVIIEHPAYFHTISRTHTLTEIMDVFTRTQEVILPVAEEEDVDLERPNYTGLILLDDVQALLSSEDTLKHIVIAEDLEVPFASVALHETMDRALEQFASTQYPELPVVDEEGKIVGFVRQSQVIGEYHRAYLRYYARVDSEGDLPDAR